VADSSIPVDRNVLLRTPPTAAIEWARRAADPRARVLAVEALHGGISHANHAIRLDAGAGSWEVVLRRWVRPDWLELDAEYSPAREVAVYGLLGRSAVPAPRLLAADLDGRECDVPAILVTRAPGRRLIRPPDVHSFVEQLASVLPLVHGTDPAAARRLIPEYQPYYLGTEVRSPAWSSRQPAWGHAIHVAFEPAPEGTSAFIHRDYHPGNTLWHAGRLTAVVDWASASWGPPAVDVAHMRLNLAVSFGLDAADEFLDAYRAVQGGSYRHDPRWDVRMAVDFLPDLGGARSTTELARLDDFVVRALARL
jgi:aminoglycoside phosphotransferase (APT) family kinase protein